MENSNEKNLQHSVVVIGLAVIAIVLVGGLASVLVLASEICLILFLGVLFCVFLSRLCHLLAHYTSLAYAWSLAAVTTVFLVLTFGFFTLFGVQIDTEIRAALDYTDEGIQHLNNWAERYPTLESVLRSTPFLRQLIDDDSDEADQQQSRKHSKQPSAKDDNSSSDQESDSDSDEDAPQAKRMEQSALRSTAKKGALAVAGLFRSSFGLLVNSLLIFFTGLFLAIDPGTYRDGFVKLFPVQKRERTREIMNQMGDTLWHWLIGRFGTMTITGGGAGLLLWALGIPMAFTLGVITALLSFVPNIGPAVALVLAFLFALPQGGSTILYVVIGYFALQLVESYVITPLIQRQQAALPPALLLSVQALMGVIFGFLGTAVASPLLAVSKVAVEQAYIKDVLMDPDID